MVVADLDIIRIADEAKANAPSISERLDPPVKSRVTRERLNLAPFATRRDASPTWSSHGNLALRPFSVSRS
jgi:hypothetical protein